MNAAPQEDLTMSAHTRAIARQARTLELETGEPSNPFRPGSVTDLNRLVVQLADIVAELAKQQESAQRRLTAGCGDRGGECGQLDGSGDARGSDRHVAPLADIMTAIETGCDMVTYSLRPQSNAQQTVDAMHAAVALLRETVMRYTGPTVTVDARSLETGEPVPVSATVRKVADPLDEDDHRPRHDRDGDHWHKGPRGWYLNYLVFPLAEIANRYGPLTFCDCDDATIEAESGATD